jgi:hypothetical protein
MTPAHPSDPMNRVLFALLASTFLFACPGPGRVPASPAPHRPKEIKGDGPKQAQTDCPVTNPETLDPAVPYVERSISESINLATEAGNMVKRARTDGLDKIEREGLITEAVSTFITALAADPYNVNATYNLAAIYASIDRRQCSLNLLERLLLLRKLPSQQPKVELKLDRLLGQDRYKGRLDPDFNDLRDDPGFRALIKKFRPPV